MKLNAKSCNVWFWSFTGVFTMLMAFVFWGAWSPDVSPVMPDNPIFHPLAWWTQASQSVNSWLTGGKMTPGDLLWGGYLVPNYWVQELKYVFAGYCAALGLAYFLRGRGLSNLASYGAGLLLSLCGYWFSLFSAGHFGWFIWMTYGVFAFGLVDRAVRFGKMRHWVLLGACVAWGSMYQPDLWLLFTVLTSVYAVAVCAWERRFPWKGMLVAALVFAVIGAPSVWDAFANALSGRDQQIAESAGSALTGGVKSEDKGDAAAKAKADAEARWIFATNWSLPPAESLEFFIPRINGDTSCPMTLQCGRAAGKDVKPYTGALGRPINAKQGNYRQHSLYVGWITCLLALFGAVAGVGQMGRAGRDAGSDRRVVLFFTVAAVAFWLFSMGRYCAPVYRVVYALPFGDYLRAPVKWHHLTEFCLCVLAGFGIERLRGLSALRGLRGAVILCAVILVGAFDLARIDKLYCAPIDLRVVRGQNAAADFVLKNGKGKVADLVEGGNGLLSKSFGVHEVDLTGNPNDEGVRFVWVGTQQVNANANLAKFLEARATPVGYYVVTGTGIRSAPPTGANAALYQVKGVPPPIPVSPWKKPQAGVLAMGILSLLGTVGVLGVVSCSAMKTRQG